MIRTELPDDTNCRPFSPLQVQSLLQGAPFPWWISGGWALDLFLGRQTRPHFDIDIAMPRSCQALNKSLSYTGKQR